MKKLLAALAAVLMLLSFAACKTQETPSPLSVNGTPLDAGIFTYYLDKAYSDPSVGASRTDKITYATNMCIRYVALNSTFEMKGLSLSPSDNVKCSDEANSLWAMYRNYYTALGITKQTFVKLRLSEAYRETLRLTLFVPIVS